MGRIDAVNAYGQEQSYEEFAKGDQHAAISENKKYGNAEIAKAKSSKLLT